MSGDTQVALIGALILTAYVAYSVIREWQKINAYLAAERQRRVDDLLDALQAATSDIGKQAAENAALRERLAAVEARELPRLDEIRAARAEGRRLASERDDLIAQGVDPRDLLVPLWPSEGGAV